jgi:glutamate-ammonia-ligase adenylyltransferase
MGYAGADSFLSDYQGRTEENRRILEQFLSTEGAGTRWIYDVLHPQHGGGAGLARLAEIGFDEPERAREELMQLYAGPHEHPNSLRVRQAFTNMLPILLEEISCCASPGAVLTQLGRVLMTIKAPAALYDLLAQNPRLPRYLVSLVDNSAYLSGILAADPGLFDALGAPGVLEAPATRDELQGVLHSLLRSQNPDAAIYRFHSGEMLRIGMRDLFIDPGVRTIGSELTLLAEVCIDHVLQEALARTEKRYGAAAGGFAVVGMGKLGGREMGYGSDRPRSILPVSPQTSSKP